VIAYKLAVFAGERFASRKWTALLAAAAVCALAGILEPMALLVAAPVAIGLLLLDLRKVPAK
jgi:hypothetical protein